MSTGLVSCRYNKNHKVKNSRLLFHEKDCPDRDTENVVVCAYDPSHKVKASLKNQHEKTCPRRPKEDKNLLDEMENYINNQVQLNRNLNYPVNNNSNISVNSTNRTVRQSVIPEEQKDYNNVVGLRKTQEKKRKIEEEKNFKKLIEQENYEEVDNMNITYPENEEEPNSVQDQEERKFDSFMNRQGVNLSEEINDYNPNESETYERNNLNKRESNNSEEEGSYERIEHDEEQNQSKDINEFDSDFVGSFQKSREGGR